MEGWLEIRNGVSENFPRFVQPDPSAVITNFFRDGPNPVLGV
jgi:hypothetical protein